MVRTAATLTLLITLGSCAGYERDVSVSGHAPSAELLTELSAGPLPTARLTDQLGLPTAVLPQDNGSELWVYDANSRATHEARLLPLVVVRLNDSRSVRHLFEVSGDDVVRHWTEDR